MEKAWHLFIWLFVQCTVTDAFVTSVMGTWLEIYVCYLYRCLNYHSSEAKVFTPGMIT